MSEQLHCHLVYVGDNRFQLTLTLQNQPSTPLIEVMTIGNLERSIRQMKPGAKTIRFANTTIDCDNLLLDALRGYFRQVLQSYLAAKAAGRDLDVELRKGSRPDLTDGSGGLSLN